MINPAETTKLESAKLAALRTSTKCTGIAKARQSKQSYRHRHINCAQRPRVLTPDAASPSTSIAQKQLQLLQSAKRQNAQVLSESSPSRTHTDADAAAAPPPRAQN